jgi:hypothetical protein
VCATCRFGGAITLELPTRFVDVSQFRHIPDTQEVFADVDTDQSFIVELLDLEDGEPDASGATFHFNPIAHDNGEWCDGHVRVLVWVRCGWKRRAKLAVQFTT